jgi:hypothetical protein
MKRRHLQYAAEGDSHRQRRVQPGRAAKGESALPRPRQSKIEARLEAIGGEDATQKAVEAGGIEDELAFG